MARVLVACEFSGVVRRAFRALGHDAWSCDLLPAEDGSEFHFINDARKRVDDGWDLMIAHPPCTYLSVSGMHWTTRGLRDPQLTEDALQFVRDLMDAPVKHIAIENPVSIISSRIRKPDQIVQPWMLGDDASKKTCLWLKNLPKLEWYYPNCVPPKGYQRVMCAADMVECDDCGEPFCPEHGKHYGECDCIRPTEDDVHYIERDGVQFASRLNYAPKPVWGNQTPSGQNKLGPSEKRAAERSRTFEGIAQAMAEQWGAYVEQRMAA
jgi:hypothetical protein